ncbi:DUF4180 domain-containing protein [Phenylobacterium sp. J367]|uniref:DUF4180 domain-containing protein n=1 Tax=Phenylobacterium sp. J367 TaxID=2898435 RepID=UPI002151DBBD|nr:DUF4180 domain-containing protein [Phenylobacterium sp. J367]MCR5877141.1 DUF4180 domain-containing protein [Phenylobacterium sp. J367]
MAARPTSETLTLGGTPVLALAAAGPPIAGERDATDVIGDAFSVGAKLVAIPLARLTPEFLDLKTRVAGLILQKFVNYGLRVAIVGSIAAELIGSSALTDFVRESNRGKTVWFVADLADLEARLVSA